MLQRRHHSTEGNCRGFGRGCLLALLLLIVAPLSARAGEPPGWAFPVADKVQPPSKENGKPKILTGSDKSYTQEQIDNLKRPPDWFPDMHPPMPPVVGEGASTFACGSCHLPIGTGHDESAYLAGLPASYLATQMADFKNGTRKGFGIMPDIARALSDADLQAAAHYFASLPARPWVLVVETDTVPKTYVNASNMRVAVENGGSEPLGERIVELPQDTYAAIARDPRSGFVAYVPKGSIAEGRTLVTTGGGKTTACVACHGSDLKGMGDVPAIAGRHTGYIVRQLYFFQTGERAGPDASPMHDVVANLTAHDMLVVAAYLASLDP
jgi:cytochrome c553